MNKTILHLQTSGRIGASSTILLWSALYTLPLTKPNFTFYIKWVCKLSFLTLFIVTWENCSTQLVTWVNCSTQLVTWVNCSTQLVTWVNCSTQLPSAVLMWFLKQLHSVFLLGKKPSQYHWHCYRELIFADVTFYGCFCLCFCHRKH